MILALAFHTLRECSRRSFPYVTALALGLLVLASHLFQAFSFGAGDLEAINLALSAVFLAGLTHAAFLGTTLIRADLARGTLGLILAQPVSIAAYLAGRFVGLVAASLVLCLAVAGLVALVFVLPLSRVTSEIFGAPLLAGWARALLPIIILQSAALAASAALPRLYGPLALIGLFLAGSLAGRGPLGWLLPDFALFGLEAGASPAWALLIPYTAVYSLAFLLIAYILLAARPPLRSQS